MAQKTGDTHGRDAERKGVRGRPSFKLGALVLLQLLLGEGLRLLAGLSFLPPLSLSPLLVALAINTEPRSAFASGKRGAVVAPLWLALGWAPALFVGALWLLDSWFQRPQVGSPEDLSRGSSLLPVLIFGAVAAVFASPPVLAALVGPDRPLWASRLRAAAVLTAAAIAALVVIEGARLAVASTPQGRAKALLAVPVEGSLQSLREARDERRAKDGDPLKNATTFGAIFVGEHCESPAPLGDDLQPDATLWCDLIVAPPGAKVSQVSRDVRAKVRYGLPVQVRFVAWASLWVLEQNGEALAAFRGQYLEPSELRPDDLSGVILPPRAWLGLSAAGLLLALISLPKLKQRERALGRLLRSRPGRMTESGLIELDDGSASYRPRAGETPGEGAVAVIDPPSPAGYRDEASPEVTALPGDRDALVESAAEALSSRYALSLAQLLLTSAPLLASALADLLL